MLNDLREEIPSIKVAFFKYFVGVYSFTDLYDNSFEFHHVEESAIEKFNLTEDKSLEGKTFKVYYKTKSFSKSDTGDLKYVIVDLELIE